jgi:hypothetical protein
LIGSELTIRIIFIENDVAVERSRVKGVGGRWRAHEQRRDGRRLQFLSDANLKLEAFNEKADKTSVAHPDDHSAAVR